MISKRIYGRGLEWKVSVGAGGGWGAAGDQVRIKIMNASKEAKKIVLQTIYSLQVILTAGELGVWARRFR